MEPAVTVIIVNWNTSHFLAKCVDSVIKNAGQTKPEIIVVDNASSDDSVQMCESKFSDLRILKNGHNVGYGLANNQGVDASSSDICCLLNSDTVMLPGSLEQMASAMKSDSSIAVAGPRLLNEDGSFQPSCMRFPTLALLALQETLLYRIFRSHRLFVEPPMLSKLTYCDWVFGAAMMIRKDAFKSVSGFDPKIWMYGEEMELCYRLRRAGWRIAFDPGARIIHYGEASWRGNAARPIQLRQAGLLYFYRKHFSSSTHVLGVLLLTIGTCLRLMGWLAWTLAHVFNPTLRREGCRKVCIYYAVLNVEKSQSNRNLVANNDR